MKKIISIILLGMIAFIPCMSVSAKKLENRNTAFFYSNEIGEEEKGFLNSRITDIVNNIVFLDPSMEKSVFEMGTPIEVVNDKGCYYIPLYIDNKCRYLIVLCRTEDGRCYISYCESKSDIFNSLLPGKYYLMLYDNEVFLVGDNGITDRLSDKITSVNRQIRLARRTAAGIGAPPGAMCAGEGQRVEPDELLDDLRKGHGRQQSAEHAQAQKRGQQQQYPRQGDVLRPPDARGAVQCKTKHLPHAAPEGLGGAVQYVRHGADVDHEAADGQQRQRHKQRQRERVQQEAADALAGEVAQTHDAHHQPEPEAHQQRKSDGNRRFVKELKADERPPVYADQPERASQCFHGVNPLYPTPQGCGPRSSGPS